MALGGQLSSWLGAVGHAPRAVSGDGRRTQNGHIRNDTRDASRRILCGSTGAICRRNRVADHRACTRVTLRNLHGKEGVDGSSTSEGSAKAPETGLSRSGQLAPSRTCCRYGAVYGAFWSSSSCGALDFIFDATSDGRPLKALSMCDEFTRESLASRVGRSITADDVVAALDEAALSAVP
jgi:hypothetical protein